MKKIKLHSEKYTNKYALVDDEDYDYLNQFIWYIQKSKNTFYVIRNKYKSKKIYMHREILDIKDSGILTDHINGDGLNNQRYNIRTCTRQQNNMNRRLLKKSKSKYKGVYWHKKFKRWYVKIKINNKTKSLGAHKNEKNAALIYDYWANKLFKEFAYLNFPNELLKENEFKKIDSRKEKSSKYIGVSWSKRDKKWQSFIYLNKKQKHIGRYNDEIKAAKVRDQYIIDNNLQNKIKLNF